MSDNYKALELKSILKNNIGQGLVEYALILVLIAIVVMTAVKSLGNSVSTTVSSVNQGMQ